MNITILAGLAIIAYYLLKQKQPAAQPDMLLVSRPGPTIEFTTTTPVPISTEPGFGKTKYTFKVATRWANLDPVTDIITVQIGYDTLASIQPRASTGSQSIPVTLEAVPGGTRQVAVVVKNIAGIEYNKAAAYENISFGAWA